MNKISTNVDNEVTVFGVTFLFTPTVICLFLIYKYKCFNCTWKYKLVNLMFILDDSEAHDLHPVLMLALMHLIVLYIVELFIATTLPFWFNLSALISRHSRHLFTANNP